MVNEKCNKTLCFTNFRPLGLDQVTDNNNKRGLHNYDVAHLKASVNGSDKIGKSNRLYRVLIPTNS